MKNFSICFIFFISILFSFSNSIQICAYTKSDSFCEGNKGFFFKKSKKKKEKLKKNQNKFRMFFID